MIKVRPIIPRSLSMFAPSKHKQAIERTMKMGEQAALEEIKALTSDWSSPPSVEVQRRGDITGIIVTDKRWVFADEGTKSHVIRPKRAKVLHFTTRAGDEVFTKHVNHPGTKARYLSKQVQRKVDALNLAQTFSNIVGSLTK